MTSPARPGFPGEYARRPLKTVAQLAAEQGVRPVDDLDELSALWPADDDPEALDTFIAELRASGRRAEPGKRLPG